MPPGTRVIKTPSAPSSAAAGIVVIQATKMRRAIAQRVRRKRCATPVPSTEPVIVCVVETGKPADAVA